MPSCKSSAVLLALTIVVVALCLLIGFNYNGYLTIVGFMVYPVVAFAHLVSHSVAIVRASRVRWPLLILMLSSHALLIAAFLLQYDVGDGPGCLKISAILEGGPRGQYTMTPTWWPKEMEMRINLLLFVPVLATWIVLLRTIRMNLLLFVPILATWLMLMMARQ